MTDKAGTVGGLLRDAVAAHQNGRLDTAAAGYARILALSPDHADALHLSGLIDFQKGDPAGARERVQKAIGHDPENALYFANLGRIEMALENLAPALQAWQQALALAPGSADLLSDVAGAYLKLEMPDDALKHAAQALAADPAHGPAALNKGLAEVALGQVNAAIATLSAATRTAPDHADLWFELAGLYQQTGQVAEAETAYLKTIELSGSNSEACNNLGNLLRQQGRIEEAIGAYQKSLQANDRRSDVHSNLGVAYQETGKSEAAVASYRQALEIDPANAEAHRNLGMALLQTGQFEEGWAEYEWRWQTRHFEPIRRTWAAPRWQGREAPGKTLLVHCEQGFGDSLQFARYLPHVAKRVGRLIVEAPEPLQALLQRLNGVSDVVIAGHALPQYQLQIPMLSLPHVLGTTLETIPAQVPYLSPDATKAQIWQTRLNKCQGQRLVGLAWQGSQSHQRDGMRSPGYEVMASLLEALPGLRFVSLQKEGVSGAGVEDYTAELHSFDDTAALISNLDAVVTPDTVIAHLAGALAMRTFVILPHVAEWRWLQGRADSPWYPNATLIRQPEPGDWMSCIRKLQRVLPELVRETRAP